MENSPFAFYSLLSLLASIARLIGLSVVAYYGIDYIERKINKGLTHIYPDEFRAAIIGKIFSYVAIFVILAAALHECGINVSALLGAAGVVGIAVGYAAKSSIANVISGFFLMLERPFEVGDTLVVEEVEGKVVAVNLFAVTLQMSNGVVRIPHEKLLKSIIVKIK